MGIRSVSNWNFLLNSQNVFSNEKLKNFKENFENTNFNLTSLNIVNDTTLNKNMLDINLQRGFVNNNLTACKWELFTKSKKERRLKAIQRAKDHQIKMPTQNESGQTTGSSENDSSYHGNINIKNQKINQIKNE